jgi:hypothetical protein
VLLINGGGREVSVFSGNINGLWGKIMDEAGQNSVTEVYIQLTHDNVKLPDIYRVLNGRKTWKKDYDLEVYIFDFKGNQIYSFTIIPEK